MRAIRSLVLLGLSAVAFSACGNSSHKTSAATGGAAGSATAGAAAIEQGDAGAEPAEGGSDSATAGESGRTSAAGGTGGFATTGGGGGAPNTGGTHAAGAGQAAGAGGGGAPAGGIPGAGTSSTAGGGNGAVIEPPAHCSSVSQTATVDACAYEYVCDGRTHFDSCSRDSDGGWACECGTFADPTRYFELAGVEAPDACGVIARVCESEVAVSPTRTCLTKEHSVESDTCSSHATCGHTLDFESGIIVREVEHYRSRCKTAENSVFIQDAFDCSCEGGAFDRARPLVTAPSIDAVCGPMLEYCTAEMNPVFTGRVCGLSEPSGVVDQTCPMNTDCRGCMMAEECGKSGEIARDVAILNFDEAKYRYAVCLPQQGDWQCTCETSPEGLYGDQTVSQGVLDVCRESRAVCSP